MLGKLLKKVVRNINFGLVIATTLLFVILAIFSSSFISGYNIYTIMRNIALYAFIGLAQAVILAEGDMNLSVGAIGGLTIITAGYFLDTLKFPIWVAVAIALLLGIACGFINGFISAKFRINAFIVTLSTLFIYTGINFGLTKGFSFINIPQSITVIGKNDFLGIPLIFIIMIAVLIIFFLVYERTVLGRRLLAVGQSAIVARFSGISDVNLKIFAHSLSGFLAAFASMMYLSRMGTAQPATGEDWLIISFAVAIIGGTSLMGGVITPLGIFFGAFILVLIRNGLILLNVNVYWTQVFLGLLILLSVGIDAIRTYISTKRIAY